MFPYRVHPNTPPEQAFSPSPDLSESPRSSSSSSSSAQHFIPKPPPTPGDYIIQVQKDQILRVPPPENAHRVAAYSRRAASRRHRGCLCCLAWAAVPLLLLLALAAAAAGVLYLVFHPKEPVFSLEALSVKGFNLSAPAFSPEFLATVRAENPNTKIGIYYLRGGDVSVSSGGVNLCHGVLPAFFHGGRNVTVFQTTLRGAGIRLSSAMHQALVTAQNRRQVPLLIDAKVPVRVKVGTVTSWTVTVKVRCDVTVDNLTAVSKVVSESCRVKVEI